MAKRKLEELEEERNELPDSTTSVTPIVHISLDTEDEDDDDDDDDDDVVNGEAYALKEDDIEGQEEGAAGVDGDVHVTPFNMKEEMEEGHFDAAGMYHWKKDKKEVRDNWLENIDWIKINKTKTDKDSDNIDDFPSPAPVFNTLQVYRQILPFLKPKETVVKALQRIAGNRNMPSSERWKRKKAGLNPTDEELEAKANVTKLTELADSILQNTGNMDVYQETYEFILEKLNASASQSSSSTSTSKAAELDMYADDFDEKEKVRLGSNVTSTEGTLNKSLTPKVSEACSSAPDVMWEFKWTKEDEKINGPHTTEQMNEWSKTEYFKGEVWVRKCGVESDFHSSKRIDFELYM